MYILLDGSVYVLEGMKYPSICPQASRLNMINYRSYIHKDVISIIPTHTHIFRHISISIHIFMYVCRSKQYTWFKPLGYTVI